MRDSLNLKTYEFMVLASDNEVNLPNLPVQLAGEAILALEKGHPGRAIVTLAFVADAGQDGGGLLGDLPSHRPSVRSPRRKSPAESAPKAGGTASGPVRETRARPAGTTTPNAPEQRSSGAEQLARAGAGLALAPARIGLRLAGRAVDGLGKAVGRN